MKMFPLLNSAAVLLVMSTATVAFGQDVQSKSSAELVEVLVKTTDRQAFFGPYGELSERIRNSGKEAEATARLVLSRRESITADPDVEKCVNDLSTEKKSTLAARLLMEIAKAKTTVASFKKGHIAVGRVVLADGKLDPELVLAQMEILPEGYFAGEVGDLTRPLGFRAEGYAGQDVSLEGKSGDLLYLGTITLKPVSAAQVASVKGNVKLDNAKQSGAATLQLSLGVPRPNTPHNGYSPRRRWPEPIKVAISKNGEFVADGLSPGEYTVIVEAPGHARTFKQISLSEGQENDAGTINLKTTDLGFYIGKPAPKTGELAWEKDYQSALKKAQSEKKPLMVMMTATWCGPCKMLEKETLNDPWIRHFLSSFVIVKAYEDKDVEKTYGMNGYPTLVFTDSIGKEAHRTVGYQPVLSFAAVCAKAHAKLGQKLPSELQRLVEEKVISIAN